MIKKHKMARLLPNGLAITTNTSQKYVFVSLLSRDSVYDMLRRVCTHLQPSSKKSLSVREFPEEPECESLEVLIPEMKWRKVCPASRTLSLQDNIPCIPRVSVDSMDSFFPSRKPPGSGNSRLAFVSILPRRTLWVLGFHQRSPWVYAAAALGLIVKGNLPEPSSFADCYHSSNE
uniref:GRAM domain containing 2A n=1 Tax=Rousettus aegyptiacus TaxID=9407 RepID=A0A7J8IKW1_ROUAE|nr:GRAM domain containing 2A [Rousettus aegyptiacus]